MAEATRKLSSSLGIHGYAGTQFLIDRATREPASHWLRELPCDMPWDDPALLMAMMKATRE